MKRCYSIVLFIWLGYMPCLAQNLVRNGGFEEFTPNPSATYLEDVVHNWYAYFTTPDYFGLDYMDTAQLVAYCGTIPHGGRSMAGGYELGYFPDMPAYNREYIQGELTEPLKPNTLYYAEMYVKPMMKSPVISWAVSNLGMAFTYSHCKRIDSTNAFLIKEIPEIEYTALLLPTGQAGQRYPVVSGHRAEKRRSLSATSGATVIPIPRYCRERYTTPAAIP